QGIVFNNSLSGVPTKMTSVKLVAKQLNGTIQVIGSSHPIVALVGDDIILPCYLNSSISASDKTVEWTKYKLDPRFVYVWRDGGELESKKNPSYKGRTTVSLHKLKHGDISLNLSKVRLSDRGRYRCFLPDMGETLMELIVGAVSLPVILRVQKAKTGVALQCESAGWYPEPELLWLDGEGNLLSAGPTETLRGPDDLYTVSSRVTVEKRHSNNITCRVQQRNTNQTRETHIHISGKNMMKLRSHSEHAHPYSVTQDITLLCSVDPPMNAVDEMVEWSRSDLNPRFVHVWRSGEDHLIGQNPSYKNRTSVSIEKLKTGDASLKLTKVRLSDEGTYRCFIPGLSADLSVELVVVSPGVLECKSKGWYPEPDVFWLESEGKIIPAGSKEMFRGPDDLYALSSRLTLEKGHSKNITCRIQQNKQHREVKIHVPVRFQSSSQHRNSFSESHK
uniref:Ig-like domain-containing protein n=1 Tax=Maylandia zebra TaxID=106582 RepID=A0A3P9DSC1_9CICH